MVFLDKTSSALLKNFKIKKTWGYTVISDDEAYNLKHFTMLLKRTTMPLRKNVVNEILIERLDDFLSASKITIENFEYVHGCVDCIFIVRRQTIRNPQIIEQIQILY